MLSPRVVALQGVGYGAALTALQGFLEAAVAPPEVIAPSVQLLGGGNYDFLNGARRKKKKRVDDEPVEVLAPQPLAEQLAAIRPYVPSFEMVEAIKQEAKARVDEREAELAKQRYRRTALWLMLMD